LPKNVIVGTAGHIDHGKTALVQALTGVNADRWAEEQRRGITIDLGFAHLDLADDLRLGFIDVPGHERFVKTMAAGVSGIDLALLVVAADDGPMPQTMGAWGLQGTPSLVLFDRGGRMRAHHFGQVADMALGAQVMGLIGEEEER